MNNEQRQAVEERITADMKVDDVIKQYPQLAPVFLKHTINCPACHISQFHDIRAVSQNHGVDLEALLMELNKAVAEVEMN